MDRRRPKIEWRVVAAVEALSVSEPARVLRIPGSKNFKSEYGTPRDVQLVAADGPRYDIADIERITTSSSDVSANTDDRSSFQMGAGAWQDHSVDPEVTVNVDLTAHKAG